MPISDLGPDLARAAALLTRVPLRADFAQRTAESAWAYPIVGAALGGIGAGVGVGALALGLAPGLAAGLVLGVWVVLSGAMHEDGLADSADGFWGGWDQARRLEIMADSRIGTYGVLALVLSMLLRWSALTLLLPLAPWALIGAMAASRGAMPLLMRALPYARGDGLSRATGRPPLWAVILAGGMSVLALALISPWGLGALIAPLACGAIARAKIGGQTGDVLGATEQITQIAALLIFAAIFAP